MGTLFQQCQGFVFHPVNDRQWVTGFEQIGGHGVTHVAHANEKDMRQRSQDGGGQRLIEWRNETSPSRLKHFAWQTPKIAARGVIR
jgi:hypothetical protein